MKVNTVGKNVFEVELAYTAGFVDADGCIMANIEKHKDKKFGFRVRIVVKITQNNKFLLNWFKHKYKIGYIQKNRTTYDWVIKDQKLAKCFLEQILPFLKIKKKQAKIALRILKIKIKEPKDILRVGKLADNLASFNIRSLNRRKNFTSMIEKHFPVTTDSV